MNRVNQTFYSSKTYNPVLTEFKGHKKIETYYDLFGFSNFKFVDKNGLSVGLSFDHRKCYLIHYDHCNNIRRGKW